MKSHGVTEKKGSKVIGCEYQSGCVHPSKESCTAICCSWSHNRKKQWAELNEMLLCSPVGLVVTLLSQ